MKAKLIVGGVLVTMVAVAITSVSVMAQSSGTSSPGKTFAGRVATILALDESKVQQAFDQATKDARTDMLKSRLDKMVQNGAITQQQADDYLKWELSRPNLGTGGPRLGPGFHGGFRGQFPHHGPGRMMMNKGDSTPQGTGTGSGGA